MGHIYTDTMPNDVGANRSKYTLEVESVTADVVIFRRDPPYEGMTWIQRSGPLERSVPKKLPDHATQGYDKASMELTLSNMRGNGHPDLALFEAAYAEMMRLREAFNPQD